MTWLVERLAELVRYIEHLRALRERVASAEALRSDLSLHNDVPFSLLVVCQTVIDVSGELSARNGLQFEDHTEAVRNLAAMEGFSADHVHELSMLAEFRNVLVHECVTLGFDRVVDALDRLEPVESFVDIVRRIESAG